jgi:hypothetical protein
MLVNQFLAQTYFVLNNRMVHTFNWLSCIFLNNCLLRVHLSEIKEIIIVPSKRTENTVSPLLPPPPTQLGILPLCSETISVDY